MTGEPAYVVPDLVEPIIGYRSWTVRINPAGEPVLCSPYRRHVWTPREALAARCGTTTWIPPLGLRPAGRARPNHDAPAEGCTCGVHAWRSRGAALLDAADTRGLRAVTGDVALWGDVLRHQRGWRAGQAYPQALRVHAATTDGLCFVFTWEAGQLRAVPAAELALALSEAYGIPVEIDPGEDPLGPLPRHAPSAVRLPRAQLGLRATAGTRRSSTLRQRVVDWLTVSR